MKHVPAWIVYVVMAYVIRPLGLLSFRVAAIRRRLGHKKIGKLSLWGDAAFLKMCSSCLDRLKALDADLYQVLTQNGPAYVVQDAKGAGGDAPPFLFLVGSPYLVWESDGIIARLVYVSFCVSSFSLRQTWDIEFPRMHKEVIDKSRSWLEMRKFPPELVDCYAAV